MGKSGTGAGQLLAGQEKAMTDKPKWTKTKHKGIRYREHPDRKHGKRPDRYYTIRYKLDGKDREEKLGWETDWHKAERARVQNGEIKEPRSLEQEAILRFAELKSNQGSGKGAFTLEEKRETEIARKESEAREKAEVEKASSPFSVIWTKYLEQAKADGKKSHDREESLYKHWIKPVIGDKPLVEIAPIHLEKIKSNMNKSGAAPRSIHYCLAVVRQVFNFATRNDLFGGANPVGKVKKPVDDNRRMRFLSQNEAEALLKEMEKSRRTTSRRITLLSLHCGLRFGEIAALTWADVDFERATLCIRNPNNGRTRFAYMTEAVRIEMAAIAEAIQEAKLCGVAGDTHEKAELKKTGLVFPARESGKRKQMSDAFDRAVVAMGLNDGIEDPRQRVCFHTCRHSFASWLVEGGTDLFTVKELLGHKSLSMTERYSHLRPETLQKAVKGLEQQLTENSKKRVAQGQSNVIEMSTPR
jgi:integrase